MEMIKVFISQPFSGKTEDEVMQQKNDIIVKLKRYFGDIVVIDNYHQELPAESPISETGKRLWYLGNSITMMRFADVIVFSSDYKKALGCKAEMEIAQLYGLKIMIEEDL